MNDLLSLTILTALGTSGLLFCFTKWGWLGWYQVYRPYWLPPADCYFCMSVWLSLVIIGGYSIINEPGPMPLMWAIISTTKDLGLSVASGTLSAFVCTVIIGTSEG